MTEKDNEIKESEGAAINRKKMGKAWRILLILFCVVAAVALAAFGIYHAILDHYLDQINIVTKEPDMIFATVPLEPEEMPTQEPVTTPVTEEIPDLNGQLNWENLPLICNTKDVKNFLILATDNQLPGWAGRSDVMILVSINQKTGKIILCSFLRDLYVRYPTEPQNPISGGMDKLNHAFAYGGATLTMAVFKETFNVEVDQYVHVDFNSFIQVVDAVGGLDVELTADEVTYIYGHMREPWLPSDYPLNSLEMRAGTHHLNGAQALAHARNRYIGSDWARTQRQRTIIQLLLKKVGTLSLSQLNNLLETTLPLITTNIPKNELKSLVSSLPGYLQYSVESTTIPQGGTYQSVNYNMIPDLSYNCHYLYEVVYGKRADGDPRQ